MIDQAGQVEETPGEVRELQEAPEVGGRTRPCIVQACEKPATGAMEIAFDSKAGFWGVVNVPACGEHRPALLEAFNAGRLVTNMHVTLELLPEAGEPFYSPASGQVTN